MSQYIVLNVKTKLSELIFDKNCKNIRLKILNKKGWHYGTTYRAGSVSWKMGTTSFNDNSFYFKYA